MAGGPSILLLVLVLLVLASSQVDVDVGAAETVLEHGKGEEGGKDAAATTGGAEAFKFPPMFVLNLDRAPDRWKYMLTVLDEQGLSAERLPAVDGKNLTDAEMRTQSTQLAAFLQPRGVIGCYLSHKRFWQLVVDRNLPEAIIFEDDVRLVDDFKGRLGDFLRRLQAEGSKPYDVLLLGAIGRVHPEGKDNIGSRFFSSYIGGKRRLEMVSEFVYKPRRPAGTHAYMVSNSGARRLLGLCPKATFHVDLDVCASLRSPLAFAVLGTFSYVSALPTPSNKNRPGATRASTSRCSTPCSPTRLLSPRRSRMSRRHAAPCRSCCRARGPSSASSSGPRTRTPTSLGRTSLPSRSCRWAPGALFCACACARATHIHLSHSLTHQLTPSLTYTHAHQICHRSRLTDSN